ncbi:protein moonraker isoform X3 [Kryptolebias marmoratus]|uniref:protein moonraker isoform X3 n=1 Tax=Kryptolebias marmoratus TaxID=37003 RepID=UPI0007F89E1C|nr:protein moonraker isoform X3 [Kryptolebias marmoratus]
MNDRFISLGQQTQDRDWVAVDSTRNVNLTRTSQTKLLFNEAIPASAINRATRVGPPAPIVIERLLPRSEMHESVDSIRGSVSFASLSEERIQAAVKLAKRDLRRRRFESLRKFSAKPLQESSLFETSDVDLLQELTAMPNKAKGPSPKEKMAPSGTKQHTSKKSVTSLMPRVGQSPPTRDPGLKQVEGGKQSPLSNEIRKLQCELERYIRKVEELANRGEKTEEPLEPEEQSKLEIRRQKQAARSARVIYVLQQQVKEIQEDIEKLQKEKMWDTKKSVAINRLAAAHRGVFRALQVIIHQLSDLSYNKVPPQYKELGQLIRQLCLCSAKAEVDRGSAVPETALDILQKLEILDSALGKQEMLEKMQAQACPPHRKSPHRSVSPTSVPKSLTVLTAGEPRRPVNPRRGVRGNQGKRHTLRRPKTAPRQALDRREVLRVGLQSIAQQRELREQLETSQTSATRRKDRHAESRKADTVKDARFQQPTVSSRLRVNQLPQREQSVPWIPTSPHSPPQQRKSIQRARPEPRCLFSPVKASSSPPLEKQAGVGLEAEFMLSSSKTDAQNKELRSEVVSQNQWADGAEQKAGEINRPLSREKQQNGGGGIGVDASPTSPFSEQPADEAADAAERLSEALLDHLLEDAARAAWAAEGTARGVLRAPTLESMLLRMEEMQRDEEAVRRRFASITYSDPLYWDRPAAAGSQSRAPGSRSASPQPIRLTKPALKQTSTVDIVLKKPVDTGHSFLFESGPAEEASRAEPPPTAGRTASSGAAERSGTAISVPGSTLRSVRRYQGNYDTYLRAVAHEAVGSFNPWAVADSLADELLSEALADVAREFQDVVEEYAEAVFTSEFLRPIRSPPASAAALVGQ